ncbi:shTK domain protein [Ostertagia ostertagi]
MLRVVVACFAFVASASATAFTDMNCTNGDAAAPAFLPTATVCDDKYSTAACASLFGTAVVPEGTTDRDAKCLTDADVKEIAIANCPKSCGFCCMTPEYTCKNADFPRVKCSTVTPAQCRDATWRTILAEDCPNVCGFCLEGGCVDTVIECENDPSICRNIDMQTFVKENCKKTCGYCPDSTSVSSATTASSGSGSCPNAVDSSSRQLRELGEKWLLYKYILHTRPEEAVLWKIVQPLLNGELETTTRGRISVDSTTHSPSSFEADLTNLFHIDKSIR